MNWSAAFLIPPWELGGLKPEHVDHFEYFESQEVMV